MSFKSFSVNKPSRFQRAGSSNNVNTQRPTVAKDYFDDDDDEETTLPSKPSLAEEDDDPLDSFM